MTVRVPRLPFSFDPLIAEAKRRARQRRLLVAIAVVMLAALAAGVTLALRSGGGGPSGGHPGAFNGVTAAQHVQTGANVLPPSILAALERTNANTQKTNAQAAKSPGVHGEYAPLLLDTARLLGKIPGGSVYGLTNTHGDFCTVDAALGPHDGPPGFTEFCSPALSRSLPITMDASNGWTQKTGNVLHVGGVAMDGVTSVSFTVFSKNVTVPVKNNVYGLNRHSRASTVQCAVAHFADGSSVNVPVYPCRSAGRDGDTSHAGS